MKRKRKKVMKINRKLAYESLKDVLPESNFVAMCKAEFEEECNEIIVKQHSSQLPDPKEKKLSCTDIYVIEKATIGQSDSYKWQEYRKGRITASNFYRVYTRAKTLQTQGGDASKLVESLQGLSTPPLNLSAFKYGKNMEIVAKQTYLKKFEKEHQNAKHRECGLFIHEQEQFLGATPDLLLECCCGNGLLEIKCP